MTRPGSGLPIEDFEMEDGERYKEDRNYSEREGKDSMAVDGPSLPFTETGGPRNRATKEDKDWEEKSSYSDTSWNFLIMRRTTLFPLPSAFPTKSIPPLRIIYHPRWSYSKLPCNWKKFVRMS
ncbi:hypothetical protein BJ322DRAFT_1021601 [Thelephora terrestris]|uniref:Uncharacterized protein n=1 Tax=Thelephora terrestris TaxID=56493 RepID=A0A9P6HE39_9AGAM|nr:hypothetical protein BJ322DRAFT_1021601 [Thelephora terrestris]